MGSRSVLARGSAVVLGVVLAMPALAAPAPATAATPAAAMAAASPAGAVTDLGLGRSAGRQFAEGVVVVGYARGAAQSARANVRAAVRANAHAAVSPLAEGVERLILPPGASVAAAIAALQRNPAVRFAQPDYVLRPDVVSNDPAYLATEFWGMYGPATEPPAVYGSNASGAWAAGHFGSRSVAVGIVDTGVDINHPDLAPNIWTNPFETAGNGIDDDGNGYVDDVHGWDFYNDNASVYDGAFDAHGTHVAGTVGAVGGNAIGVVGVNWAVTMIPVKFIQGDGLSTDLIAALDYLTDLKTRHGIDIVATNNSYVGDEFDQALLDAINRAGDAGILFVAAAGNEGRDTDETPTYPQAYECTTTYDTELPRGFDCIISVTAIDVNGYRPTFANYGLSSVDLGAPGVAIESTVPGGYAYSNGTSMATPHVTGSLALLAACQAEPTPDALRSTLLASVTEHAQLFSITTTGGILDVGTMTAACTSPQPPRALFIVPPGFVTGTSVQLKLWLSDAVTGLAAGDLTIGGTSTGWSLGAITGSGAGPYTIPVSATSPTDGTLTLTLQPDSVTAGALTGPAAAHVSPVLRVDRRAPAVAGLIARVQLGAAPACGTIPLRLSWTGTDFGGSGIVRYELGKSINAGAWTNVSKTLTSPAATVRVNPTGTSRFRVRAVDALGRTSPWLTGPALASRVTQQTSTTIAYSTGWTTTSSSLYCGGSVRRTGIAGKSATFTFTGRSVGLISTVAPSRGKIKIYVDGTYVATVDLFSSSTIYRRIVWEARWGSVATHRIRIVVQGTLNRPRFDLDGFVTVR